MTLKLFDLAAADPAVRFSPFCWRSRMALAHKGLEVEALPWRFVEKERLLPSGGQTVPVLIDGETWITDSARIAEHLDRTYPEKPLFEGPQARAHAAFIDAWTVRVLHPGIAKLIMGELFAFLDEGDKAYFRESREKRFGMSLEAFAAAGSETLEAFRASLAPLRATLEAQDYLGGASPSYADYIVFGGFQWGRVSSARDLLAADDPIAAWRGRLLKAFDGVGAAVPARAEQ